MHVVMLRISVFEFIDKDNSSWISGFIEIIAVFRQEIFSSKCKNAENNDLEKSLE